MNMKLGSACSMIYAPWVETSTFAMSSRRQQGNSLRGISTISYTCSNQAISSDGSGRDLGEEFAWMEGCFVCDLLDSEVNSWRPEFCHISLSESVCVCSISVYVCVS